MKKTGAADALFQQVLFILSMGILISAPGGTGIEGIFFFFFFSSVAWCFCLPTVLEVTFVQISKT